MFIADTFSHWRNDRDRYLFECWVGEQGGPSFVLIFTFCPSEAIALAGPGSALLSYIVVGVFVYTVVIAL